MLKTFPPPHIRHKDSNRTLMDDVLIVLIALYFMAVYYYGIRAALLGLLGVFSATGCDLLCKMLLRQKISMQDHSSLVTALIIPLLLPASVPYTIVVTAIVFALLVVKYPFGGMGHNLFNPAAGGFAFVAICFPKQVFTYPLPLERLAIFQAYSGKVALSSAFTLQAGGIPAGGDFVEMLLGNTAGPMGATNVLLICTCLLYLMVRGSVRWHMPLFFVGTCAAYAYLVPRVPISGAQSVLYELFSGFLIFGAVFMLCDPVTSPKRSGAQMLYAVFAGVSAMLFRQFGGFEEPFAFSLLLCNAFAPNFDFVDEILFRRIRRRRLVSLRDKKAQ